MINKEVGKISIIWTNDNDFHLQVDIEEGSDKAVINGYEYDLGMAPIRQNNAFYIPSNLFISLLEMEIKHDKELDAIIIERKEDFPKEILVGTWSNTETSPFTKYTDIVSGSIKYPTVVTAYKFNKDGSYRCLMVGMDSFQGHVVVDLKGKYKIHGNTVALYDILETFYKGMPPQLEYKDKRYDSNRYAHIHNYFSDEERIRFDATLLRRIE